MNSGEFGGVSAGPRLKAWTVWRWSEITLRSSYQKSRSLIGAHPSELLAVLPVVLPDESCGRDQSQGQRGSLWLISGVGFFRLSPASSRRNSSNSFNLASQSLVSTALITSVAPAWTPSSLSAPFQEGDNGWTPQPNEALTNAGPRGGMAGGRGMSRAFYVCGIQSALKMARRSVDLDQMPWMGL